MYSILMLKLIKSVLVEQVKKAETALRKANNEKGENTEYSPSLYSSLDATSKQIERSLPGL